MGYGFGPKCPKMREKKEKYKKMFTKFANIKK